LREKVPPCGIDWSVGYHRIEVVKGRILNRRSSIVNPCNDRHDFLEFRGYRVESKVEDEATRVILRFGRIIEPTISHYEAAQFSTDSCTRSLGNCTCFSSRFSTTDFGFSIKIMRSRSVAYLSNMISALFANWCSAPDHFSLQPASRDPSCGWQNHSCFAMAESKFAE
jgi:hypothetical protein